MSNCAASISGDDAERGTSDEEEEADHQTEPGVSKASLHDTLGGAGWVDVTVRPFDVPGDDGVVMAFWLVHALRAERLDSEG
jgi:hypothetical protein